MCFSQARKRLFRSNFKSESFSCKSRRVDQVQQTYPSFLALCLLLLSRRQGCDTGGRRAGATPGPELLRLLLYSHHLCAHRHPLEGHGSTSKVFFILNRRCSQQIFRKKKKNQSASFAVSAVGRRDDLPVSGAGQRHGRRGAQSHGPAAARSPLGPNVSHRRRKKKFSLIFLLLASDIRRWRAGFRSSRSRLPLPFSNTDSPLGNDKTR